MDQMTRSMKGCPWGGFSAVFATALLFMALPLLTRIQVDRPVRSSYQPVFIRPYKPPPPPTMSPEQPEKQTIMERAFNREIEQIRRVKPKFVIPSTGIAANRTGWVKIETTPQTAIEVTKRGVAWNPNEVDQPPRYLRTAPPQYPYSAKRDNIEGRVLLRFVVDLDGLAKEAEVVKAEPAGVFEEAALKALDRYKFKPAVKDGKTVMCNAALTITFVIE